MNNRETLEKNLKQVLQEQEYNTKFVGNLEDILIEKGILPCDIQHIIFNDKDLSQLTTKDLYLITDGVYKIIDRGNINPKLYFEEKEVELVNYKVNRLRPISYPKKLYNEEWKVKFLETYVQPNTRAYYTNILSKAYKTERVYRKDVYSFTHEELDSLFSSYKSKTLQSLISIASVINQYIDWLQENKYINSKINFTKEFGGVQLEKYIKKDFIDNRYVPNLKELYKMEDYCINAQDAICIDLLYNGVNGVAFEELVNLRITDCDFKNNTLTLTRNDGTTRQLDVNNRTMRLIQESYNQQYYEKANGDSTAKATSIKIVNSEYIIRPVKTRTMDAKATSTIIAQRVKRVVVFCGNPLLTPTSIWISGMIHYAKLLKHQNNNLLTKLEYQQINKRFGYNEIYWYTTKTRLLKSL